MLTKLSVRLDSSWHRCDNIDRANRQASTWCVLIVISFSVRTPHWPACKIDLYHSTDLFARVSNYICHVLCRSLSRGIHCVYTKCTCFNVNKCNLFDCIHLQMYVKTCMISYTDADDILEKNTCVHDFKL